MNERPLQVGAKGGKINLDTFDLETNTYLCPNQLPLGRSSVRIPAGPFQSVHLSAKE